MGFAFGSTDNPTSPRRATSAMSDFTVHTLLTTPLIEVRDVVCAGTCRHKGAVERTGRMQLVFPCRGVPM